MKRGDVIERRTTPEGPAVISYEELVARCMGNLDFATRAVARFRQDFAGGLAELRQAADEAASERVATIAHRLKGAAAMIAAHRLQEVSAEIESLGRNRDPDQISCRLDALEGEWARFVDNVAL